jgi:hypothetical protein
MKTLSWNPSAGATGYRAYASMGALPFALVSDVSGTSTPVVTSSTQPTRFFVTAYNATGESGPSETVTNTPPAPPTGPVITLMPPGLSTTNLLVGQSLNLSALIQNTGDQPFTAVDGALTLLPPGATRDDGPYIHVTVISPPLVVNAKASVSVAGTWAANPGVTLGIYSAYLVVKSDTGIWTASPYSYFTVSATPTNAPPQPPSGLRFSSVGSTRADLAWVPGDASIATEVQRATDNASFQNIAVVASGVARFSDTRLRKNRRYVWRVRHPGSDYSNTVAREPM